MARNFPVRRRGPTSTKSWSATNDGIKFTALSGSIALGAVGNTGTPLTFIGTPPIDDLTVLRTRGRFAVSNSGVGLANNDKVMVAVGLGVVPGVAGQTIFPTPIVDADWDGWFLHETLYIGTGAILELDGLFNQMVIDSKAMRKLNGGSTLIASFDALNESGALTTASFSFWARFLNKVG